VKLFPGNEATLNFYLCNFTDVASLAAAIRNIPYKDGNTNTTGGMRLMRQEIFNRANCDRPRVPNVAVLITDGNPTREVEQLPSEVQHSKALGVRIVGVGVTDRVSLTKNKPLSLRTKKVQLSADLGFRVLLSVDKVY